MAVIAMEKPFGQGCGAQSADFEAGLAGDLYNHSLKTGKTKILKADRSSTLKAWEKRTGLRHVLSIFVSVELD